MRLPDPPLPSPILLGFSGGLDSSVLLQLLAADAGIRSVGLRALHVHHGLHADADAWAAHCRRTCEALGVPLEVVHVQVDLAAGLGVEGAARAARHAAFAAALGDGEILALAHHRDDQAETFLLRALRGAGADGLAAMRPWRGYARGWLWRPLLELPRSALYDHAASQRLQWIDDPANANTDFDRNFLRNAVLPLLGQRWQDAAGSFARSAALCAQAVDLLEAEDAAALAAARSDPQTLEIRVLQALPVPRRARVLRRWIAALQLPPLPGHGIARIERELLAGRHDANARFDWQGARVWRWRGLLHADVLRAPAGNGLEPGLGWQRSTGDARRRTPAAGGRIAFRRAAARACAAGRRTHRAAGPPPFACAQARAAGRRHAAVATRVPAAGVGRRRHPAGGRGYDRVGTHGGMAGGARGPPADFPPCLQERG